MIINVHLHKEIVETLTCFGYLPDVINRILQEGANGKFDVTDKPACPDRSHTSHYRIDITEPQYLEMYNLYGANSPKISLRRLIYWFVENEVYSDLNWIISDKFNSRNEKILQNKINKAYDELQRAILHSDNSSITAQLKQICKDIENVKRYLNNDR